MNFWKLHIHKSPHTWRCWYVAWGLWQPFKYCRRGGWFYLTLKSSSAPRSRKRDQNGLDRSMAM